MKKEEFEFPEIEVIMFDNVDILTISGGTGNIGEGEGDEEW